MYENDSSESTEQLLKQIRGSCLVNTSGHKSNVAMALPTFSALLVKLSNEASKTADKNIRMQKWLIGLTISIVVFTIVLIVFGVIQIKVSNRPIVIPDHIHQKNAEINKITTTETKKNTIQ